MYKPQPQDANSTNQPPVAPSPTPPPAGTLSVLAPEGHFPKWLEEELKGVSPFQVTSYFTTIQAKEKILNQSFDLYLITDRLVIEGLAHQKFQVLPDGLLESTSMPIPTYLHHSFDPSNQYSLPYGCTFYGLSLHKDAFPKPINEWEKVFENENFSQTDFPIDPELFYTLTLIAEKQIGKTDKKVDFKTPTDPQSSELPIRVRPLSELYRLAQQNPAWQVIRPLDGSAIELFHVVLGTLHPPLIDVVKKIFNPLVAARLSEENHFASTLRAVKALQSDVVKKNLYPDEAWMNKTVFIRPPKAAKAH